MPDSSIVSPFKAAFVDDSASFMADQPYKIEINLDRATDWVAETASSVWNEHPLPVSLSIAAAGAAAAVFAPKILRSLRSTESLVNGANKMEEALIIPQAKIGIQVNGQKVPSFLELSPNDIVRSTRIEDENRRVVIANKVFFAQDDPGAKINQNRYDFLEQWRQASARTFDQHLASQGWKSIVTRIDDDTFISTVPIGNKARTVHRKDMDMYFEMDPDKKHLAVVDFTTRSTRLYSDHKGQMLRTNIFSDGKVTSQWLDSVAEPGEIYLNYMTNSAHNHPLKNYFPS